MSEQKVEYLSSSRINTYCGCSKKYYYKYIMKLNEDTNLNLVAGSTVHLVLETYNRNCITKEHVDYKVLFCDLFNTSINNLINENKLKLSDEDKKEKDELQEVTCKLIDEYLESEWSNINPLIDRNNIPFTEYEFSIPIYDPHTKEDLPILISGKIDNVVCLNNNIYIIDYKLKARSMQFNMCKRDKQMTAYYYVINKVFPELRENGYNINIAHIQLLKQKKPKIETIITERTEEQVDDFMEVCKNMLKGIENNVFIPADNTDCAWCNFRNLCDKI